MWLAPVRGDKKDRRCVFVTKFDPPGEHARVFASHWCFGCGYYVCDRCNEARLWTGPKHDVATHQPSELVGLDA